MPQSPNACRQLAAWSIYPASWLALLAFYAAALHGKLGFQQAWAAMTIMLLLSYMVLERLLPFQKRWSMTWASFKADAKYILANIAVIGGLNGALGLLTISLAAVPSGPAADLPLWAQMILCLLVFEGLNYAFHRAMHELPGRTGLFLWNVHAAHHLPERVYVVMHAVFHPLNAVFVQVLAMTLPIWLAGYDQRVVTLFLMLNSMHGLISHFNVDVRMGVMNYIFVGTELHRLHHSADAGEAKNYGAVIPLYDLLFGTFVYKPGAAPATLGVADPELPPHPQFLRAMALPFGGGRAKPGGQAAQ